MANLNWSTLYELSSADRIDIVNFIKADHENHAKLVAACSAVPTESLQQRGSPHQSDQYDDFEMDAMLEDPVILAQLDQQQQQEEPVTPKISVPLRRSMGMTRIRK